MRTRLWPAVIAAILTGAACGGTPAPANSSGSGQAKNVGEVAFVSSQGQPANEAQKMNGQVLTGFSGHAEFISGPTASQDVDKVTAEQRAGRGTIDVLALQHGDFTTLGASD